MKAVALVAVMTAAACSSSSSTSSSAEPTCEQRVDRFAAQLAKLDGAGVSMPVPGHIDPVVSTQGKPVV